MKKTLLILLASCVFAGCSNKNDTVIEGTVTGLEDGTTIYLLNADRERLDSTLLANGAFRFDVKKVYPDKASLTFGDNPQWFYFILEPGTIVTDASFEGDNPSVIMTGTDNNNRLKAMTEGLAEYTKRQRELAPKLSAMEREGLEDTPEFDSLLSIYQESSKKYDDYKNQVIIDNPNTIFAAYLEDAKRYAFTSPEMLDSVLNQLGETPPNAFVDRLRERRDLLARTAIGQPAIDFTQNQPDGTPFTLSSLKGKLVLIDFWASWCGPCRRENPHVVQIYNRFKDHGFEIVGVSLDRNREDWLKGIEEDGLTWIHVSDLQYWDSEVGAKYGVASIPHTVLVDSEGVIIAKNLRGQKLEEKIAEVLGVEPAE